MISATKDGLENGSGQEYDGVLNIDVFNQGIKETLLNNTSGCGDATIKSTAPSNRIKLEYFNIDRSDKSVLESIEKCTAPFKDANFKFPYINKHYKGITATEQSPNKYEKIGFTEPIRIGQSKNRIQCCSKLMSSKDIKEREKTASVGVENKLNNDSNKTKQEAMENEKISKNRPDFQVRKAKYLQLIGNHAYLNKFDREQKEICSRDVHFLGTSESSQKSYEKNISNHPIENVKTGFKSTSERLKMLDESLNNLAKPNDKTVRGVGKSFIYTGKLSKNIRMNYERPNNMRGDGNCSHFPEYFQVMNSSIDQRRGEELSNEQNTSYQIKHHTIINSSNSSSNTSTSDDIKCFKPSQNQESHGLALDQSCMAGKRGEGDNNFASDSTNLSVKILLPLKKNFYHSAKPRARKSLRNFKLQKQFEEKLENSHKNQQSVERQQLYYNFLLPENNFIEKCFGGKSQNVTPQIIQPPIIENGHSRNTNICRQTNSPYTNQDLSPESSSRVEFMSVHKKKSRNRNSKLEKNKVYPGNIVKMGEDESPCEYLNQFSSILIDNLKDPIPKDPLNLPTACNVYVPMRKRPIPLERYAEHNISTTGTGTSNVTVTTTTTTLSETNNSNSQSVSTSKSIIILKKISKLTERSDDKDKNTKCLNEKPKEKRNNNRRMHRQSDQSFVERPCCCFIQ